VSAVRKRSRQVEPRAFEELLSVHLDALYRTALRLCGGHRADAEDLLQDAVLRAFEHFESLKALTAVRAWLFTILVRTNLNRVRSRRRRAERLAADLDEREFEEALAAWQPSRPLDAEADAAHLRERLATALEALDGQLRPVAWLVDVEGFRQREVAEMLGIPEGTVASRLFRARRTLREALGQRLPSASVWREV
jgi:RNA polymerase sigma-70 factor (ECF subfamily)